MLEQVSFQAGPSIWIIIVVIFYIIRLFTKGSKKKNQPNPPVFDSRGNDDRPGKSIEEILRELQGNFEEKNPDKPKPRVIPDSYIPEVKPMPKADMSGKAKRAEANIGKYKPMTDKVDLSERIASSRISKKAQIALHSRRKIIDSNEGLFGAADNRMLEIENIGEPKYNDISSDYTLDDLKQGIILQAILERPEF